MKYLLLFSLLFSGCTTFKYSIRPGDDLCVQRLLRECDYCYSENMKTTTHCYGRIKLLCEQKYHILPIEVDTSP